MLGVNSFQSQRTVKGVDFRLVLVVPDLWETATGTYSLVAKLSGACIVSTAISSSRQLGSLNSQKDVESIPHISPRPRVRYLRSFTFHGDRIRPYASAATTARSDSSMIGMVRFPQRPSFTCCTRNQGGLEVKTSVYRRHVHYINQRYAPRYSDASSFFLAFTRNILLINQVRAVLHP